MLPNYPRVTGSGPPFGKSLYSDYHNHSRDLTEPRMMSEDDSYGVWPRSGEIDIAEARGNGVDFPDGGRDTYTTSMHWGEFDSHLSYELHPEPY